MLSVPSERETRHIPSSVRMTIGVQVAQYSRMSLEMFDHGGRGVEHRTYILNCQRLVALTRTAGVRAGEQAEIAALHDVPKVNAIVAAGDQRPPIRGEQEAAGRSRK